jgi:hypothetical protein
LAHVNSCISGRHSCTKRGSFPFDLQFAKAIAIRRSADCRTSIKRLELEALKCTGAKTVEVVFAVLDRIFRES